MKKFLIGLACMFMWSHLSAHASDGSDEFTASISIDTDAENAAEEQALLSSLEERIVQLAQDLITDANHPKQTLGFFLTVYGTVMRGNEEYIRNASKKVAEAGALRIAQENTWSKVKATDTWSKYFKSVVNFSVSTLSSPLGIHKRQARNAAESACFTTYKHYREVDAAWKLDEPSADIHAIERNCAYAKQHKDFKGVDALCEQATIRNNLEYTLKTSLTQAFQNAKQTSNEEMQEILRLMTNNESLLNLALHAGGSLQKTLLTNLEKAAIDAIDPVISQTFFNSSSKMGLESYRLVRLHFLKYFNDDKFAEEFEGIYKYIISSFDHDDFTLKNKHIMNILTHDNKEEEFGSSKDALIAFLKKYLSKNNTIIK